MDSSDSLEVMEAYMRLVAPQDLNGIQKNSLSSKSSVRISQNEEVGRYLTATRDIAAGEILLCETPLVIAPQAGAGPTCLHCLKYLHEPYGSCKQCSAPLCLETCVNKYHTQAECQALERLGEKDWSLKLIAIVNAALTPLRAWVAIEENKSLSPLIMTLQSNAKERKKLPIGAFIKAVIIPLLRDRLGQASIEDEFIHRCCGVFDTSAFKIETVEGEQGRALLPLAAMMMHDCAPNSDHWFSEGKFIVRAALPIKYGEAITISYTVCLIGTQSRIKHLSITKLFTCTCNRCKDPTELGTHISSLRCRTCKSGLVVPPEINNEDWQCNECQVKLPQEMTAIIARAGGFKPGVTDRGELAKRLHDVERMVGLQHYGSLQMLMAIWKNLSSSDIEGLSGDELRDAVAVTEQLMEVVGQLLPGLTIYRGELILGNLKMRSELQRRKLEVTGSELLSTRPVPPHHEVVKERLELCRAIFQHHPLMPTVLELETQLQQAT
uniref:Protein msta-like n=2 Tax=Hirondellea gigas TaxID=1518452 RepID=A0A6A7FTB7_9CRUS